MTTIRELTQNVRDRQNSLEMIPPEQRSERASSILVRDYNEILGKAKFLQKNPYHGMPDIRGSLPASAEDADVVTYRDLVFLYQQVANVLPYE